MNNYVPFITDEHFLLCVQNLHKSYIKAKNNLTKQHFYSNKVDTIKLTFDAKFNGIDEESLIQSEILRQIDKSINNSIGTFHEQILGGIKGFEIGNSSGFDIKAEDGSLYSILSFTKLPENIEECIFERLCLSAKFSKTSLFYYVDLSFNKNYAEKWVIEKEESTTSHKRVFKISVEKFYDLLTGNENSIGLLQNALPAAIQKINMKLSTNSHFS